MLIELETPTGQKGVAKYTGFSLSSPNSGYTLDYNSYVPTTGAEAGKLLYSLCSWKVRFINM